MRTTGLRLCILGTAMMTALGATAAPAQAQVHTFRELQPRLKSGEKITITDQGDQKIVGRLQSVSGEAITLTTPDGERTFSEADVKIVEAKRMGSLLNGAIIGGAAVAIPALIGSRDCHSCEGYTSAALGLTALGVGIGVGIDAAIWGNVKQYVNQTKTTVSIAPFFLGPRKGVAFAVRF